MSQQLEDIEEDNLTPAQISAVISNFNTLKQEASQTARKIAELEVEQNEHKSVMEAIKKLDPARKCFRLVGGVLVERTVGEVLPAVTRNFEGISAAVAQLNDALIKKQAGMQDLEVRYGRVLRSAMAQKSAAQAEESKEESKSKSSGVLI
eukprot:TRINITY_DN1371_c0_g1_i1.p1 TRINITY_DN1371_c0_g1~~TRINITY_DN1371_c0_g1_i1.p1  ORF type:complete len:150 (-),score=56.89 TRINITY_DN1371_c0_g1_i1:126-575(-)